MELGFTLTTIFEIAVAAFIIYGLFNEEKFVATERRVARIFRRKIKELIYGGTMSSEKI